MNWTWNINFSFDISNSNNNLNSVILIGLTGIVQQLWNWYTEH